MAHLYRSELRPSKIELVTPWLASRVWFGDDSDGQPLDGDRPLEKVAAFRLDDPEGRVGIETMVVGAAGPAGPVVQVPLTYRDTPLEGAEQWLLGTLEHSVLGTRWVYDAVGDPAYLRAIATAALGGRTQADEYHEVDGARVYREPSAIVAGSGGAGSRAVDEPGVGVQTRDDGDVTVVSAGHLRVALARVLDPAPSASALAAAVGATAEREVVSGSWRGHDEPVTFAVVGRG